MLILLKEHPLQSLGLIKGIFRSIGRAFSEKINNSIALRDAAAIGKFQQRYLAHGIFGFKPRCLRFAFNDIQIHPVIRKAQIGHQ